MSLNIHKVFNAFGLEVRLLKNLRKAREDAWKHSELEAWRILDDRKFQTILDVGANEGQFARMARELWPTATIHSFEPLPQVHAVLVSAFAGDALFQAHNIAISDRAGSQVMHCSAFTPSSSLLPMADVHKQEWPQSAEHVEVEVALLPLDDWARANAPLPGPMLIKIDVQGFELHVINGGLDTLSKADVVVLEVAFQEFYEGQPLFADIHARMHELGFAYRGNVEQYLGKDKSSVLYADAIFTNTRQDKTHG